MRKSKFSQEKIVYAITLSDQGTSVPDICREMGISHNTFYQWKKKYAGMAVSEAKRLKELEKENQKLKRLVADLTLDKHMLQEVLAKKW